MEQYQDKNGRLQQSVLDRTGQNEITAEFVLPDYHSEISRLLWVRPTLTRPECFARGGRAELTGRVCYEVLYTGPDGALYGTTLADGYHFSLPLEGCEESACLLADCHTDAIVARVMGPRKLAFRTRVGTRVQGYADKTLTLKMNGTSGQDAAPCRLCDTVEGGRVIGAERTALTLTDSMDCAEDVRIVSARGQVFLPEVNTGNDCVHCRGEAIVTVLLVNENEPIPYTVTRRIPFSGELLAEGVTPECEARAEGIVSELHTAIEGGKLIIEPTVSLSAEAQTKEICVVLRDVFLPKYTAQCRFATQAAWQAGSCRNRHLSISGERPLSDTGLVGGTLVDVTAEAEIHEKVADGARITLSGELKCHLLTCTDGEYGVTDVAFPFRTVLEDGSADCALSHSVPLCRATLTGDALRVDAELQLAVRGMTPTPTDALCEATFTPTETDEQENAMELYYPATGETLWSVAKRYGRTPEAIAAANGIDTDAPGTPDSLAGHRFVLIP